MSDAPALRLSGVTRRFPVGLGIRRRTVLDRVDLELARGATLALVGPNGSGKSTLLRLVAGVDRPSGGTIEVLSDSPARAAVRRRLAYLPEDSPFPPELSARAALDLLGALSGLPRRDVKQRGEALLERVGLAEHRRRPLRGFSRGMLRRFGLAQTFLSEPELVLLDEPTAGLDAEGFGVLEDLLAGARRRRATVVLASHLLSDVLDHGDELALLLAGRVAAHGAPAELLAAEGRARVEVEGLDAEGLRALERWVAEHGGAVRAIRPGGRTLLELYGQAEGAR